jgi:cytochrome P450
MSSSIAGRPDIPAHLIRKWDLSRDPEASVCPFRAAAKLLDGPDVFFNPGERHARAVGLGGNWVVTRQELQREVYQNPEVFSSHLISGFSKLMGEEWPLVPLELDAPEHMKYRIPLNSLFSPARINELDAGVREAAVELIEKVRDAKQCDFMEAFGRPFPVSVFLRLMGLPADEMPLFLEWEEGILRGETMADRARAANSIKNYLVQLIAARRAKPTDDLVSFLVSLKLDGQPISDERALGICYLFYVAGLDTVASTLGFAFRELAQRPELQQQLRAEPSLFPDAVEEFVRAFGVVVDYRYLTRDHEFHGVQMRRGDLVELPLGVGSRDPHEYPDPHRIDFRRENTRSITFAAGPHRCIGSHLARREFRIALEEWTVRVPEFRIRPGDQPRVQAESVWGVSYLPLAW